MKNYLALKRSSYQIGDQYYDCLLENLKHPTPDVGKCHKLGKKYRAALRKQLQDLKRFSDIDFVQREREMISEYLQLIENDLGGLESGRISDLPGGGRPKFG